MLVYAGLSSYGAWEFVDIPDQYVFDKCGCICLLFCNHFGEFSVIVLAVSLKVTLRLSKRVSVLPNIFKGTKSFPVDRGFIIEPKNIVKSIRYTYCLLNKLTVKLIIY